MRNHVAARALLQKGQLFHNGRNGRETCCLPRRRDCEHLLYVCTPQKAPRGKARHNRAPPARPATLRAAAPKGK